MEKFSDKATLIARAEAHAALLESVAALIEIDGIGLDPCHGHVQHLRRMAGTIRAQATLGKLAQTYVDGRYLPGPSSSQAEDCVNHSPVQMLHYDLH
jgi:hypothetical protein